ncbi:MAG: PKD domain-containing protein, partial [Chitinophagales bacterium]
MILRNFILILASLFISYSFAQCSGNGGVSISPAKSSYCAGEPITFQVNNPNSNFEYRIRINGVTYDDTIVTVGLPGAATTKIYTVDVQFKGVIGGWISCQPLDILKPSVTISPSPDPTLIDVTPEPTQSSPFRQCQQLSNNYTLDVQNGSTTASSFNQTYIIDWGDGTTTGTISNFTNLSHTYNSPGGYTLAFTVSTSDLSAPCNTVTHYYDAYFGVLPNVGISKVGALIKCAPVTAEFLIDTSVTNRNPIGTSYDIFVGGELIATYNQPAPRNIFHTYTKTSCGENCSGKEYYEIKVVAKNGCGDLPATVCEPVSEQPKPILQVPDTVCIGVATPHINQTQEKDLQSNGTCQPLKTEWTITPSTGWTLNSGDMTEDPTINVTYDVAGTYLVEMRAISTLCGDSIITKNVVAVPKPDVAITVDKNSLCTGESVNVSNVSSNPSTVKYTWSITPNTGWTITSGSITSTNFTVLFNNASNYTITLSANQSGCTDVASETINVKEAPTITQQGIFDTLCSIPADLYPYFKFTFDKGGDANTTFNWELDGATPSSSSIENPGKITYANAGDYTVFVELVNQ